MTVDAGHALNIPVTGSGFPAPVLSEIGKLPSGVTWTDQGDGTATLAGTPSTAAGGAYPITITASNGVLPDVTQSFELTVEQSPAITSADQATFTQGQAGTFTPVATGYPAPSFSEHGALPNGVHFTGGVLSGTPATGTGGAYPITITASNGVVPDVTQSFQLTVEQSPAITSADRATFTQGQAGTFTPVATGYPAPTFSEHGALPNGVHFTGGVLSGTPSTGTGGAYPITITAANGVLPDVTQSFQLAVEQSPAITSADQATFTQGQAGTFTPVATGYPAPSFSEHGALPNGVHFTGGVLSGTPAKKGTYRISFAADNGIGAVRTQNFLLIVKTPSVANDTLPGPAVGMAALPDGTGYWVADAQGGVSPHGNAVSYGSMTGTKLNAPVVYIVATPDGKGYWLVASDGGTFAFGDAGFYGSMAGRHLNAPVVGLAPTSDGKGYWLAAADGGIFAFGDARFHGSTGGDRLRRPVVGIAADNGTGGYWEVASDGSIFAFAAPRLETPGAVSLNEPVNGIVATSSGRGYWLVADDGGIFAYGDAEFRGSTGGRILAAPIVGMATDNATDGYWLVSSRGGILAFGVPSYGSS